jgi:L-alanine-DL-glutamate epimerase-like enolase superfamily enzyme
MNLVRAVYGVPLRVPLVDPFILANARLDAVQNVAVRVVLESGIDGWGEIGTLHPITHETFDEATRAVDEAAEWLPGVDVSDVEHLAERLAAHLPHAAATRAGLEMACWEAAARTRGIPLFQRFGGLGAEVVTDITVPIVGPARAAELGALWKARGFTVLKLKVGSGVGPDLERIAAIRAGFPEARFVLDANEGWSADEALEVVRRAWAAGADVLLLEQPVPRGDLEGLARVNRESGVLVAADEAVRTVADVEEVARLGAASVVNVKIAKSGVLGAFQMLQTARRRGLGLMIGAMVETRIGTGFSAHLVAGMGGFTVVDLDTPWLMTEDPIVGGPTLDGSRWRLPDLPGHGARPSS